MTPPGSEPIGLGEALQRPQRSLLADDVYEILKDALLRHQIAPGSRLNLDALARELHVSNTPVRQALGRLEADGLVTKEPFRGFAASQLLDSRTITELYDFRLMLEPTLAARAASRHTTANLAELDHLCATDEIAALTAEAERAGSIGARDVTFHCAVARQAGNSVAEENVKATLNRMLLYSLYDRRAAADLAWTEHRAVVSAIRVGDPEGAANAMRTHLANGLDRFRTAFT
ncbi:MAG TPA: GntR family transcriptional regulator [Actinokineospora sp.]|jgi:DNA-binding GntR family transcriptional regulator|nr:GntR family transcriptional regulator [Actinokineospora sp.]